MLFIQGLHEGVEQPAQRRIRDLLHDFGSRFLGIMFRNHRAQAKKIHGVFLGQLVRAPQDKLEVLDGHVHGFQECGDDEAIVFGAELDELDGGFEIVKKAVNIGEQHFDSASCA